jgi:hypothetical protein
MTLSFRGNRLQTTWIIFAAGLATFCPVVSLIAADAAKDKSTETAQRLSDAARQAEIDGDSARCFELLRQAVRIAPDYQLARWQLGQIEVDGQWVAVEEAQRRAAADPKQARYQEVRKEYGESPAGQIALAHWCRKNNLEDEARFHWASVLSVDPGNEDALRALDMRWQNDQLLTRRQIAEQREKLREAGRLEKQWSPTIAKWQRAVEGDDSKARELALEEIGAISTTGAIVPLEQVTLASHIRNDRAIEEHQQMSLAFLTALGKLREQAATESLVRHAVLSANPAVRSSAIEKLHDRPLHDYVPILLSGLAMPVESSFSVRTARDGSVHYMHSLYREGPDKDWAIDANYITRQHVLPGRDYQFRVKLKRWEDKTESVASKVSRIAARARSDGARYVRAAAAAEAQVSNANQAAVALNSRIIPVLASTTGQDFTTAKQWWDWWQDNNEYYAYDHPVEHQYYSGTNNYFYGQLYDTVSYNPSCFCKGTPVWTKTGQRPIETLEIGDLVLAQDVDTGELAYKPIVGRTVRPPSEILDIRVDDETVRATRGHPFWVSGVGWRMAKELGESAILHGVTGSARVEAIEPSGKEEAYNLVVSDFNTYFVGQLGLLAHDNMPRKPTRATVPGLALQH